MEKIYQFFAKNTDGSYIVLDILKGEIKTVFIQKVSEGYCFEGESKERIKGIVPESCKASGFYGYNGMPYFYKESDGFLYLISDIINSSVIIADFKEKVYFLTEKVEEV